MGVFDSAVEQVVEVAGAAIHCFLKGEGSSPTLVLLHGNGEDHRCFERQWGAWSKCYRLIAIDSRGHGASTFGDAPLTIGRMAEDVLAVLDALGVEKAHVLGFSDGANVALDLALAHPDRVSSLVLAGGNLFPAGVKNSVQLPIVLGYGCCAFCGLFSKNARQKASVLGLMVKGPHVAPEALGAVDCPTLVLAGERDMIKEEHTCLIASHIPGARLHIIPGADHMVFTTGAVESCRLVSEFLKEVAQ